MKLFYFDIRGQAECTRLMFNLTDIKFEDVRFDAEAWEEKYKALAPSGAAPWLELDDGSVLTQSSAINMYAANLAGFHPSDPLQVARTIELVNLLQDVFQTTVPSMSIKDSNEKLAARKALIQPDGAMAMKMKVADTFIGDLKTEFYCADQPTLADYYLFTWLSFLRTGFLGGITLEFLDSFEKMSALRSKVANLPKVNEMYDTVQGFEP